MKVIVALLALVPTAEAFAPMKSAPRMFSAPLRVLMDQTMATEQEVSSATEPGDMFQSLSHQAIHPFGNGQGTRAAPGEDLKGLLGGKGANLAEMAALGLPVPPGFTITTEVCSKYEDGVLPPGVWEDALETGLKHVESSMGLEFGNKDKPLLLSVRSGAAVSMPGMVRFSVSPILASVI